MKIQKGIVKYKDRDDIECLYGATDDGKFYYFLDATDTTKLSNGNRIVSTELVEAIDPMVKASHIGLIDENGNEVIACNNRSIRSISNEALLVEPAEAISESVKEANKLRSDPLAATRLVSTPSTIKDKINAMMGSNGRYIFNDQFSEATIYDINGNNLVNGEFYSFIGVGQNMTVYMAKNTPDTEVLELKLGEEKEIATDELVDNQVIENPIDVSNVEVAQDVIENEINNQEAPVENINQGFDMNEVDKVPLEENQIVEETIPNEEVGEEIQIPTGDVEEEATELENTIPAFDFALDETKEEVPQEEIKEEVNVDDNYPMENSEIDSMVNNFEEDADRFKDYSEVETDKIEDYSKDYVEKEFDDSEMYRDDTKGKARIVNNLIRVVKTTKGENDKLEKDNKLLSDKVEVLTEKTDMLTAQSREYKAKISKLEERNDVLEDDLREANRTIEALRRENASLRQGENELNRVLEEAQVLLDDEEDYSYARRKVA